MAKLNIDFAVNLGNSISGLQQFQAGLNSLAAQLKDFSSSLKAISSTKIDIKINTGEAANANQQLEASTEQTSAAIVDLKTRIAELNAQIVSSQNIIANTTSQEERIAAIKDLSAAQSELNRILAATPQQTLSTLNVNPQQLAAYSSALGASGVESKELSNRIAELQGRIKQLDIVIANTSSEQERSNAIKLLTRDYAELAKLQKVQERVTPQAVQPTIITGVFDKYIQEAQGTTTVLQFLNKEQKNTENEIKRLQAVAGNTKDLEQYASAIKQIETQSKKLQALRTADPLNKTKDAANQANLVLVNTGRIAQDLPFGFLGIANNLNPLIESFKGLKDAAKEAGTSVGRQLLTSLSGFGGLGLVISAVSAALSFSSIGMSYWARGAEKAKDSLDPLQDSIKALTKGLEDSNSKLISVGVAFELAKKGTISNAQALKEYNDKLSDTFGEFTNLEDAEAAYAANSKAFITATVARAKSQVFYAKAAEAAAKGTTAELEDQTGWWDKLTSAAEAYFSPANISVFVTSQLRKQKDAVKEVKDEAKLAEDALTEQGKALTKEALIAEASYKKLGKFGTDKAGENAASNAKKIADLYKEINDDLAAIASRRDTDPLQKADESVKRLTKGLRDILDINIGELGKDEFKALEERLKGFKLAELRLKVAADLTDLNNKLADLREEAIIFDKSTVKEQISATESEINNLYKQYRDPIISGDIFEQQAILAKIRSLQDNLNTLNVQKLQEDIGNLEVGLKTNLDAIQIKEDILDTSLLKDKISSAERSLDEGLNLLINKVVQKTPILKAATEAFIKAATDKLKLLEKQQIEQTFQLITRYELIGNPLEAAKLRIKLFQEALQKELSSKKFNVQYALVLQALIKKNEIISDAAKSGEEAGKAFGDGLNNLLNQSIVDIGSIIGEKLTGGADVEFMTNILKSFGDSLKSFGTSMIMASKLIQLAKIKLGSVGGIAAGIALVALGTAISNRANERLKTIKKADGGYISGPGTATSDSIPARLSNGEYVVKAKSVSKYGVGFLNAINSGTFKRFALGGLVANINVPKFGNPNVSINEPMGQMVPYIATTQIKGQDLRLVLQRADSSYNRIV